MKDLEIDWFLDSSEIQAPKSQSITVEAQKKSEPVQLK